MFDDQAGSNQLSRFQSTIKRIGRKPKPDCRFLSPCNYGLIGVQLGVMVARSFQLGFPAYRSARIL